MSLNEANWCPQAAEMLHNGKKISNNKMNEIKAMFLEGLIKFIDIYAQTEIGENIQIDIMKVALFVNSATFENDDAYDIHNIDDIYGLLEILTISGLPIWRFLHLSKYQNDMLERQYEKLLISSKKALAKQYPCYGCIWFEEFDTFLGKLTRCKKPEIVVSFERRDMSINPLEIQKCKWLTTLDKIPKSIYNKSISDYRRRRFLDSVEYAREKFQEHYLDDTFRIPKTLANDDIIDLDKVYDAWEDFGCAFKNKRTKTERQIEIKRAMFIEGMIRFFEIYAKCELGSNFIANISNICVFVYNLDLEDLADIKDFSMVYAQLEDWLLDGLDVSGFVKYDN